MRGIKKRSVIVCIIICSIILGTWELYAQNTSPYINAGIPTQHAKTNQSFSYTIPTDAFKDMQSVALRYDVSNMPTGFSYNPVTRTISGTTNLANTYTINVKVTDKDGAYLDYSLPLIVHNSASTYAAFTMNSATGCNFKVVEFKNQSNNANSYLWDFGNSNTSTEPNPKATFPEPGTYKVTLKINGGSTGNLIYTDYVTIYPSPEPIIAVDQNEGCAPFDATIRSTGSPVQVSPFAIQGTQVGSISGASENSYLWNFYNKAPSQLTSGPTVDLKGLEPDDYVIQLKVTDSRGCEGSAYLRDAFKISPEPKVSFTYTKTSNCQLSSVNFNGEAIGAKVKDYIWEINKQVVSDEEDFSYNFTNYGSYIVSFQAIADNGCTSEEIIDTIRFNSNNSADFTYSIACLGDSSQFQLTNAANVKSCIWDFGDGKSSNKLNPKHIYTTTGNNLVRATITFTDGCTTIVEKQVQIDGITIDFDYTKQASCSTPYLFKLSDISSVTPAENIITSRKWFVKNLAGNYIEVSTSNNYIASFASIGDHDVKLEVETASGCKATLVKTINVKAPVLEITSPDPSVGCFPHSMTFNAKFTDQADFITAYNWDFGDGTTSTDISPSHQFNVAGNFTIKLSATTNAGCVFNSTYAANVRSVSKPSIISVLSTQTTQCRSDYVDITVNYSLGTDTLLVQFPDKIMHYTVPSGSSQHTVSYQFPDAGTNIPVTYMAQSYGCVSNAFVDATVDIVAPIAKFKPSQNTFCTDPYEATFKDTSVVTSGANASYHWDFGNGTTSNLRNPAKISYIEPKDYFVSLTVTDAGTGCTDVAIQPIHVYKFDKSPDLIWADKTTGCHPVTAKFSQNITSKISSNLKITGYKWDFNGDNVVDDTISSPEYIFKKPGLFDLSLTVYAENGCEYNITRPNYLDIEGPVADFSYTQAITCDGVEIQLNNKSYNAANDPSLSSDFTYTWNIPNSIFKNGNENSLSPTVLFTESDSISFSLTVYNTAGCSNTLTIKDSVYVEQYIPKFTTVQDTVCTANSIQFTNTTSGDARMFYWDFNNDGTTDLTTNSATSPSYTFATPGNYNSKLTIENSRGCLKSFEKKIAAVQGTANFVADSLAGCAPAYAFFDPEISSSLVKSYYWDFGDGHTSTLRNPGNLYANPGFYSVSLTVELRSGCSYTKTKNNCIFVDGPAGDFSYDATTACSNVAIQFNANNLNNVSELIWDFGDGVIRKDSIKAGTISLNTKYTYSGGGSHLPILILKSNDICPAFSFYNPSLGKVVVSASPKAQFISSTTEICENAELKFTDNSIAVDPRFSINSWYWDFGDGSTNNIKEPVHSYSTPGYYTVKHVVGNSVGCTDTIIKYNNITVYDSDNLVPDFHFTPSSVCPNMPVNFYNKTISGNGSIIDVTWDYGNGNQNKTPNNHTYTYPSSFGGNLKTITLTVRDNKQCVKSISKDISLNTLSVNFDFDPKPVYRGEEIKFTGNIYNEGNSLITNTQWSFESGLPATSTLLSPNVYFNKIEQNRSITFTAKNSDGCENTATKSINVLNNPPIVYAIKISDIDENSLLQGFTFNQFATHFVANDPEQELQKIRFDHLPTNGTLYLGNTPITTSTEINNGNISLLKFIPTTDWDGDVQLMWNGFDGYDWALNPASINFRVVNLVDGITIRRLVVYAEKNTQLTLTASQLKERFGAGAQNNQLQNIRISALPQNGTLTQNGKPVTINQTFSINQININPFVFSPTKNFVGTVTMEWFGSDNAIETKDAGVVEIKYTNQVPEITDLVQNYPEDQIAYFNRQMLLEKYSDKTPSDTIFQHITLSNLPDAKTGTFTYMNKPVTEKQIIPYSDFTSFLDFRPAAGFTGTVQIDWNAFDGNNYAPYNAHIFISYANTPPVFSDFKVETNEDSALVFEKSIFDKYFSDEDKFDTINAIQLISVPQNGILTLNGLELSIGIIITSDKFNHFIFTPNANFYGETEFVVKAFDGDDYSQKNTKVQITVVSVNDAPIAKNDSYTIKEDEQLVNVSVAENDIDVDHKKEELEYTLLTDKATVPGFVNLSPNGILNFTPQPNYFGIVVLDYSVCDPEGACSQAKINIEIESVNDAPVAKNDQATVFQITPYTIDILANDFDVDGFINTSSIVVVRNPLHGSVKINPDGTIIYTSDNFVGRDSLWYTIRDNERLTSNRATLTITIVSIANQMVAVRDVVYTNEDQAVNFTPSENDIHYKPDYIDKTTTTVVTQPKNGNYLQTVVQKAIGQFTYTPKPDFNGADSLKYQIFDLVGTMREAWVVFVVAPINDAPVAVTDIVTTNEDQSIAIDASKNDYDVDGNLNKLSIEIEQKPRNGAATILANGTINYVPNTNFFGFDTLIYRIYDTTLLSDTAKVIVQVIQVDDPPVANDDWFVIDEDQPSTFDVLANDNDPDGDLDFASLNIAFFPLNGTASISSGKILYVPKVDFYGADTLRYTISDKTKLIDSAYVFITILPVNDAPRPNPDFADIDEDTEFIVGNTLTDDFLSLLANDEEVDGEKISVVLMVNQDPSTQGRFGKLEWKNDGSYKYSINTTLADTLRQGQFLEEIYYYTVADETGLTATSTLTITILGLNDPPVASANFYSILETEFISRGINDEHFLTNCTDIDSKKELLKVTSINSSAQSIIKGVYGQLTWYSNGTFKYEPYINAVRPLRPGQKASDVFSYSIADDYNASDASSITFEIYGENNAPICINDTLNVIFKQYNSINLLHNDKDYDTNDTLTVSQLQFNSTVITSPNNTLVGKYGELFWNPSGNLGTVAYTPVPSLVKPLKENELAIEKFEYTAVDQEGLTGEASLFVYIIGLNDSIKAKPDFVSINEDEYLRDFGVTDNDEDPDNNIDFSTLQILTATKNGSAFANTYNGTISYFPNKDFFGTDSLEYKICDTGGLCDKAWFYITILPVNDPPVPTHLAIKTQLDTPVSFDALKQVTDVDDVISISSFGISKTVQNGTTSLNANNLTYTPNLGYSGIDELVYSLEDPHGAKAFVIVSIIVQPSSSSAFAQNDQASTLENKPVLISILDNDTLNNVFPDPLSVEIKVYPKNGKATYNLISNKVEFIPDEDFSGTDFFIYLVCGDNGSCDLAMVNIEVKPINNPIVVRNDAAQTTKNTQVKIPILENDSDKETEKKDWIITLYKPDASVGNAIFDNTSGLVTFIPTSTFTGVATFSYQACDQLNGTCGTAFVSVLVKPVAAMIFANNDQYYVVQNQAKALDPHPITNDSLTNGGLVTISSFKLISEPSNGTISINSNAQLLYTPNKDYFGPDKIVYQVCSPISTNNCDFGEINIWVQEVNIPPIAAPDSFVVVEKTEKRLMVLANDTDPDGWLDFKTLKTITDPNTFKGTLSVDTNTGSLIYNPQTNKSVDEFAYEICDNKGLCSKATVTVYVDLGSTLLTKQILNEDTPDTLDILPLMKKYNLDFAIADVSEIDAPENGKWKTTGNNTQIIFTPNRDYFGKDFYNLKLCSNTNVCADIKVDVTVLPVNDPPVANNDTIIWESANNTFTFEHKLILENDTDVEGDTIIIVPIVGKHSSNFTVSFNTNNTISVSADTIIWCDAWIEYTISDGNGGESTARVTFKPAKPALKANTDYASVEENQKLAGDSAIDVLANDIIHWDQRCTIDTLIIVVPPKNGEAVVNANIMLEYSPTPEFFGKDSIQYLIVDLWKQESKAWVYIEVVQHNIPPVAVTDIVQHNFDATIFISPLTNDYDTDGYILDSLTTLDQTKLPKFGTVWFNKETLQFEYTPYELTCEGDKFGYTIFDNEGDSAKAEVIINVQAEAPLYAIADTIRTWPGVEADISPLMNDIGFFYPAIESYDWQTAKNSGYLSQVNDSTLRYLPNPDFFGRDSLKYSIASPCGNTASGWIIILIVELRVPEIITPDNNGKNDVLIIDGIEHFPDALLQINNRYGHLVYQKKGYTNDWGGHSNQGSFNKDKTLPSGPYYYTLTYNEGRNKQAGLIYIYR